MKHANNKHTPLPHTHTPHTETDPESETGLEVVEDEVRESLRHGPHLREVVSHDSVGEREGGRRAMGEVTHHQSICGYVDNGNRCIYTSV